MAKPLYCSFCAKTDAQVRKLAAGPGGVHICDECVEACRVVMAGEGEGLAATFKPAGWSSERLLALLAPLNGLVESHRTHLQGVVDTLRGREVSWARIAEPLGVSRQSAWERFS